MLIVYLLIKVGHFDLNLNHSMISIYKESFKYNYDFCYIFGCASNDIMIEGKEMGVTKDNGFLRASFLFGIPWILSYFLFLIKTSKSKLLPLVFFATMAHYPIIFGVLGATISGIVINYYNNITYYRTKKIYES